MISSTSSRSSSSCESRVPSSPPMPVTKTRMTVLVSSLPVLAWLRAQVGEEDHLANRGDARQQHDDVIDADAEPAARRQAVLQRAHVVLVDVVGLGSACCLEPRLCLEPLALVDGVVELGERVRELAA